MDYFNLYDPLPAVFIGLSVVIFSIILFEISCYLRRVIPKSVECWFCKHKTEVNFFLRNSWTCPSCEQYNGFNKDGNYNKVISSQHSESLNLLTVARQIPKNEWRKGPSLCSKCNLKQHLKVQHLASFVPMSETNYDKEIEHFQEQIEKNYELCENCENLVSKVLQNIREELSLPKKLYSAISQVKIRGERAIYMNILLSLLLAVSSLQGKMSFPSEISVYINSFQKYAYIAQTTPALMQALNYWMQFIIATGFIVNSVGYYQTKSVGIFLNSCSWVLMFFLTLYPAQYEVYVTTLKVISGIVSIIISCIVLMKNSMQRSKQKKSIWERRNAQLQTSPMFQRTTSFPTISRSPSNSNLSTTSLKYGSKVFKSYYDEDVTNAKMNNSLRSSPKTKQSPVDEVSSNINFGISNLNLGQRYKKEAKQQNIKPLITPPKFNPFSGTKSCYVNSDKNYHWKPSTLFSYNQYEPSVSPSVYESYEPQEPSVATITSFGCPQPCYPSCPQTLAYYFSSRNFSKPAIIHSSTPISEKQDNNQNNSTLVYSLPVIFLIGCNIFLLFFVYNKETTSLNS
ncbi:uncharacterized protein [Halyomorpha halys]|uniref:uncharacterized protein n=1 Tax=Halyomorpha halys TaxID=286706 RepID=UPI0006D512B5|nr:uncharacterized protein LOC106691397 [Halyomorpha halys]